MIRYVARMLALVARTITGVVVAFGPAFVVSTAHGKESRRNPRGGVGSSGRGAKRPGPVLSLRDSNKSRDLGCPVCGGSEWEWVDGPIVSGQLVVLRSGDG